MIGSMGLPEILAFLLFAGLFVGGPLWVYHDAKARNGGHPLAWATSTFLALIIFLPLWLLMRPAKGLGTRRRCPYCAEEIQRAAVVCRFCGREVEPIAIEVGPPDSKGFKLALKIIGAAALVFVLLLLVGITLSLALQR